MNSPEPRHTAGNVVCDLDGVVWRGGSLIPGAGEALTALDHRGYRIIFATNAPIRTPAEVAAQLAAAGGYPAREDQVITSAMAAAAMLAPGDAPVFVVGEGGLGPTLEAAGLLLTSDPGEARTVVAGLDRQLTYDRLRAASSALFQGARFVACNLDPTYPTESGLWPGGGAIVAALEAATGRTAELAGKPAAPMAAALRRALAPGPTWIVGDRPETDVALGRSQGWKTVLVLSGVVSDPATVAADLRPDLMLPSLAALPANLP